MPGRETGILNLVSLARNSGIFILSMVLKQICMMWLLVMMVMMASGQSRRSIRVAAGEDIAQAYSKQGFYRFSNFGNASLYFRSGAVNTGLPFNYNLLSQTMQFISPAGDTLEVTNVADIDSVVFENNKFYHREGFMEEVSFASGIRLLKKIVIRIQAENIGAYGQANPTASIINYNSYFSGTNVYNLSINQDIVLVETSNWLLMDDAGKLHKPSRTAFFALLAEVKKAKVENFLKFHKINFDKEKDLLTLMQELQK
jgi:hypothetical protein